MFIPPAAFVACLNSTYYEVGDINFGYFILVWAWFSYFNQEENGQ